MLIDSYRTINSKRNDRVESLYYIYICKCSLHMHNTSKIYMIHIHISVHCWYVQVQHLEKVVGKFWWMILLVCPISHQYWTVLIVILLHIIVIIQKTLELFANIKTVHSNNVSLCSRDNPKHDIAAMNFDLRLLFFAS